MADTSTFEKGITVDAGLILLEQPYPGYTSYVV